MLNLSGCAPGPENETVVLAHRRGAGMGRKHPDELAVLACYSCHCALDGPESDLPDTYDNIFNRALSRTHARWRALGLR